MKKNLLIKMFSMLLSVAFATGCLESGSDYIKELGDSGYYFIRDGDIGRYFTKELEAGGQQVIVERRVVGYRFDGRYIAAIRQVANSYECAERTIATELKDQYEYWLIDTDTDTVNGPLSHAEYMSLATKLGKDKSLPLGDDQSIRESNDRVELPLEGCTDPVSIN